MVPQTIGTHFWCIQITDLRCQGYANYVTFNEINRKRILFSFRLVFIVNRSCCIGEYIHNDELACFY